MYHKVLLKAAGCFRSAPLSTTSAPTMMFESLISENGSDDVTERITSSAPENAHFRVGSGNAFREALMKNSPILQVEWYTVRINQAVVLHSLLAVHVSRGESCHANEDQFDKYVIEKALLDGPEPENIQYGIHVSRWEDVCTTLESSPIHVLRSDQIRKPTRMYDLWRVARAQGPYKVAHCNCHHMAQALYNHCLIDPKLHIQELPNQGLISAAQFLETIGIGTNSLPFWSRSQSADLASVQSASTSTSLSSVNISVIKEALQLIDFTEGASLMLLLSCPRLGKADDDILQQIIDLGQSKSLGGRLKLAFDEEFLDDYQPRDADVWFEITRLTKTWLANEDQRPEIQKTIENSLSRTKWWSMYKAVVKIWVLEAAKLLDEGRIHLACVEGGPVSRIEQQRMPQILEEVKFELRKEGKSYDLPIRKYEGLDDFKKEAIRSLHSSWWSAQGDAPNIESKVHESVQAL